jgi:structural maintenance of chromosome 1
LLATIKSLTDEIEKMTPNMKAIERLEDVEHKLATVESEAEAARKEFKKAKDEFNETKKKRFDLFSKAFDHISERIDDVYKDLTKGKISVTGGTAYLSLEDSEVGAGCLFIPSIPAHTCHRNHISMASSIMRCPR